MRPSLNRVMLHAETPVRSNSVVLEDVLLASIREPDRQVRKITKRAIATAKAIIQECGQAPPILVSDNLTVIAGQEFFAAARELGLKTVKIVRLSHLTEEQRRMLTIALARLPQLSEWDADALRHEFNELLGCDFHC